MKKILPVILALTIVIPVFAKTNWQALQNKDKTFYIDTASIVQNGTIYHYWIKNENDNGSKKLYVISNCENNTTGVQKIISYDASGKKLKDSEPNQELTYIVPDSDSYVAYNYVCDLYKQNLQKEEKKKTINNVINTGINTGLYFLGR